MKVLVVGGAGFIGSHTCLALGERGHEIVVADNLSNGSTESLRRVSALLGAAITFHEIDIRDVGALVPLLSGTDAVIHFAALKSVGESCKRPLDYFDNNISGSITLLQSMVAQGVERLVFSSSATVYGDPDRVPIAENAPVRVTNPYARTKLVIEEMIGDLCVARPGFSAMLLRYFNPVGAHPSGRIGEDPTGIPNNLMPFISQVAVGRRERLNVYGADYPTIDGTGVRDYIHVMDLAEAHVTAVEKLARGIGCQAINLGTGRGVSVLQLVEEFEQASGRVVPYSVVERRPGDVAASWADPSRAAHVLGWQARYDLRRMCEDTWRWQSDNPNGYRSG